MNQSGLFSITHPSSAVTLKRTHSGKPGRLFDAGQAPKLPTIDSSDLILQVFTHKSLRRKASGNVDDYGDNERLAELGKIVLEAAVTLALYHHRPMLNLPDICVQRQNVLSDENIEDWVTFYNLRKKLRCHPEILQSLNSPLETRSVFYAYVGGVYSESGADVVNGWIEQLAGLHIVVPDPPPKRMKGEPESPPNRIFFGSQPPPSPPQVTAPASPVHRFQPGAGVSPSPMSFGRSTPLVRQTPPHMAPVFPPPVPPRGESFRMRSQSQLYNPYNPLAPAQPGAAFLPLFNQTASQRRVSVDYSAEFSGPSHAGRWTVYCVVNGIRKGTGTGSSKQLAKEAAAREAYYGMGWT